MHRHVQHLMISAILTGLCATGHADLLVSYSFDGASTTATFTAPGVSSPGWSGNFGTHTYGDNWEVSAVQEPTLGAAWFSALAAVTNRTAAIQDNGGTYWETAVSFAPGASGSITNLTLELGGERGGGGNTSHNTNLDIQYSLDGFATAGTSLGLLSENNGNNGWNATLNSVTVNEAALTGLDNQTVTLRFYAWIDTFADATTFPSATQESTLDNLQIGGTLLTVPEPSSLILLVAGGLSLLTRSRFMKKRHS